LRIAVQQLADEGGQHSQGSRHADERAATPQLDLIDVHERAAQVVGASAWTTTATASDTS
jgi:hypothetical protein